MQRLQRIFLASLVLAPANVSVTVVTEVSHSPLSQDNLKLTYRQPSSPHAVFFYTVFVDIVALLPMKSHHYQGITHFILLGLIPP